MYTSVIYISLFLEQRKISSQWSYCPDGPALHQSQKFRDPIGNKTCRQVHCESPRRCHTCVVILKLQEIQGVIWLVVSTHLKNISQIGSFSQVGVEIKNLWNHHLVMVDIGGANQRFVCYSCFLDQSTRFFLVCFIALSTLKISRNAKVHSIETFVSLFWTAWIRINMNLYLAFYVHQLTGRPCFQHRVLVTSQQQFTCCLHQQQQVL